MTLYSDSFHRADSTSSLGTTDDGHAKTWTQWSGTWGISSNQAYTSATSGGHCNATIDTGKSDGHVRVTVSGAANTFVSVTGRLTDDANYYLVQYNIGGASSGFWRKTTASGFVQLGSLPSATTGDVIELICAGPVITALRNGTVEGNAIDSAPLTTGTGWGIHNFNDPGNRFASFSVDDLTTAIPFSVIQAVMRSAAR